MKEMNIRELAKRMGLITVDDMCQYTIAQLVVMVANKVNELVNEVWRFETDVQEILKTQNENIQYLLGEGLHLEVENIFDGWLQDGTFDTLINQTALKKVNERIDETNARLSDVQRNHLSVSVKDFGATGDGVSDDTIPIQNAIDSIEQGIVVFPTGTYVVTKTINVKSNIKLDLKMSRIICKSNVDVLVFDSFSGLKDGIILTSVAGDYTNSLISFKQNSGIIRDCEFSNIKLFADYGEGRESKTESIAIDLSCGENTKLAFNFFNNVWIRECGTGIKLSIVSVEGSWCNSNTFNSVEMEAVHTFIDINGDYWGRKSDIKWETSGNSFTNLHLQFSRFTHNGILCKGADNYFQGIMWDIGAEQVDDLVVVNCKDKATRNKFELSGYRSSYSNVDYSRNEVSNRLSINEVGFLNNYQFPSNSNTRCYTGDQDDILVYADKVHESVKFNINPVQSSIPNMFKPQQGATFWNASDITDSNVEIEIKLRTYSPILNLVGVVFDAGSKVNWMRCTLIRDDGQSQVIGEVSYPSSNGGAPMYNIFENPNLISAPIKIKLEISCYGYMGIERLFANGNSSAKAPYIPKIGGNVFGDLNMIDDAVIHFNGGTITLLDDNGVRRSIKVGADGVLSTTRV